MNGKPTDVSIVVKCHGDTQALVMYHDTGITVVKGVRDNDGMIVVDTQEEIKFAQYPEFSTLYFNHAWDVQMLFALTELVCLEGSKDDEPETKKASKRG